VTCPLEAATGPELVHALRRAASRRRVSMVSLVRGHVGGRPDRYIERLQTVERPTPETVAKVRAMIGEVASADQSGTPS